MSSATQAAGSSSTSSSQEYIVRVPSNRKKKFSMMKFATGTDLDFVKLSQTPIKMERENNLKEFKTAYDIDVLPKFGAGSEFGREQKEEARRKKFGIKLKNYNPEDQPWVMKLGSGKQTKRFKGVREGTITENTSYYIFIQCPDGAFEAIPIEEWYNFTPIIRYKYLNSEEAEEEFSRYVEAWKRDDYSTLVKKTGIFMRDKNLNFFNIMVKKRLKNEDDPEPQEGEEKKKTSKKNKDKDFYLTDLDEWAIMDDEGVDAGDDDDDIDDDSDDDKGKSKKKGGGKKNAKINSDDEAIEESDEGDQDEREVDYITDTSSSIDEFETDRAKSDKYEEQGVDQESALKKMIDSDESEEEEEKKENEENDDEKSKDEKSKDGAEDSDSSSSDSDSDSDIDQSESIALFMPQKKNTEKKKDKSSRSSSPVVMETDESKGTKRKADTDSSTSKKPRTESPLPTTATGVGAAGSSADGITEDGIRRYLMRKPMTTKDLLQKFKSKKLQFSNEQMLSTISQLLKKINPEKSVINKTLYLSLKKPD